MKVLILSASLPLLLGWGAVQAQGVYGGLGLPGVGTLGYAQPLGQNWGWRAEFSGGTSVSDLRVEEGLSVNRSIKSNRIGAFADWFPSDTGFRLVAGVTSNRITGNFDATGTGSNTINGKPVDLTGETFNVKFSYPRVTPYLGIGYGHHPRSRPGLGFFADLGVSVGKFKTEVNSSLVGRQGITQADIDAQVQKLRDPVDKWRVLPSVALGLVYRF